VSRLQPWAKDVGMIVTGLSTPYEVMNLVAEHERKHVGYGVIEAH